MTDFRLTEFEAQSALWQKLSAHLAERIQVCRERNDNNLDAMETAKLRGQIATYREILGLAPTELNEANNDFRAVNGG